MVKIAGECGTTTQFRYFYISKFLNYYTHSSDNKYYHINNSIHIICITTNYQINPEAEGHTVILRIYTSSPSRLAQVRLYPHVYVCYIYTHTYTHARARRELARAYPCTHCSVIVYTLYYNVYIFYCTRIIYTYIWSLAAFRSFANDDCTTAEG